ncbi:Cyclin-dependent protein kinase inhibitor SMR6, partial [Mucuna pruriens]
MGFSEKTQVEGGFDSDNNKKWVIAGIALRAPLKPIYTIPVEKEQKEEVETEECPNSTTPTTVESKIPTPFTCPPAPRKRKPSFKCTYRGVVREFFTPPDLETVFIFLGAHLIR